MTESSKQATFNLMFKNIRETKKLTEKQKRKLFEILGSRFTTAYRAFEERKVKKYVFHPSGRARWIVVGRKRAYNILPLTNFCSCFDFYFRVIDNETPLCYHLIAQKLAEALEKYDVIEETDENFLPLMKEWRETRDIKRKLSITDVKNIREIAIEILLEKKELPIERLLDEIKEVGFNTLAARHLANILTADKMKRFRHINDVWTLSLVNIK